MPFLIASIAFLLVPLALLILALVMERVAPSLWSKCYGGPLVEEPFPRRRSIRGSFLTAASQIPPPATIKRVRTINSVESEGKIVLHEPPLNRNSAAKLNILH